MYYLLFQDTGSLSKRTGVWDGFTDAQPHHFFCSPYHCPRYKRTSLIEESKQIHSYRITIQDTQATQSTQESIDKFAHVLASDLTRQRRIGIAANSLIK